MQYVVMLWHPPELSPLSNKTVREASNKTWSQLPAVRQKYGIEVIAGYHLDLEHKAIVVVDGHVPVDRVAIPTTKSSRK